MIKKSFLLSLFIYLGTLSLKATAPKTSIDHPSVKRGIIFDIDGTLINSEEAKNKACQEAFKSYGINLSYEEIASYAGQTTYQTKIAIEKKLNKTIPNEFVTKVHQLYDSKYRTKIKPIASAINLVKYLHTNKTKYNILLAIASAARKSEILENLKIAGIENCFDVIVSGRDDLSEYKSPYGSNKPEPCIYLETAQRLDIPSWHCIAFEDSRTGCEAALKAGMHVFAIPTGVTKSQFTDNHYGHRITFLKSAADFDIERYIASQKKITLQKALEYWAIK